MVSRKLLVVDDDPAVREMLEEAFSRSGFSPVMAGDAKEALTVLKKMDLQVMFLDLKLPGMNGVDLCRRIREFNPISCIYAMTAYTSLFELAHCREAGFDDYFIKPINLSIFLKVAEYSFEKIERWKKKV